MSRRFRRLLRAQRRIDGWFSRQAIAVWDALLEHQTAAGVSGDWLEIGVWHGKSAVVMTQHADLERERILLLDRTPNPRAIRRALRRVGCELGGAIQLIAADSREVDVATLDPQGVRGFRWIHIDGEHTAGAVENDLALADRLLGDRGVVCLDDFFSPLYPQVTQAAFAHLARHAERYALFLCGFNKAYLVRPACAEDHLRHCRERLPAEMRKRGFDVSLWKTAGVGEIDCFGIVDREPGQPVLRGPDWDPGLRRLAGEATAGPADHG